MAKFNMPSLDLNGLEVTGAPAPTNDSSVANKQYIDNRVKTNVPANAVFTDTVTTVVDNLNSTSTTSALSAKQGKVLNDLIGDIGTALDLINGEVI